MKAYFKVLLGLFVVALLVCGILRVILKLEYMDASTGFYMSGGMFVPAFNVSLGITLVAIFLSNRLKKSDGDYPVRLSSDLLSFIAILTGVSILAYALFGVPEIYLEQGKSELTRQLVTYLNLALGCLAGVSFIYSGARGVLGYKKPLSGFIMLIPSVWQVVLLITRFNDYTTVTAISDHMLAVLFMAFNCLFLVGNARTICGKMRKDGRNYTIPAGLCTVLCGFLLVIPNYIHMVVTSSPLSMPLMSIYESLYVFVISVYALLSALWLMRSIKKV